MKSFLKKLPGKLSRRRRGAIGFSGDYASWEEALKDSEGYDSPIILEKTRVALLKVKNGEAAYERDSVLFDKIQHSFPLLAGLLRAAVENGGRLCVVDFGGALGSSYFQCRSFLAPAKKVEWLVVEQPAHVKCGREYFASDQLHFYNTIEECMARHQPDLLLLSSVIQYLPDPYGILQRLLNYRIRHVIVDRTAVFMDATPDRLTVQTVPESIYPASYPCWMLNYGRLKRTLAQAYNVVAEFPAHEGVTMPFANRSCAVYSGLLLELKSANNSRRSDERPAG